MGAHATEYGVTAFVADARRIMEAVDGVIDREEVVRQLQPLLGRALSGPGWTDPRYAAVGDTGLPGFLYYRNASGSLNIHGVLFRPEYPTPVHDHLTWGIIGVYSGRQRTTRYRHLDEDPTPGHCRVAVETDEVLTHGATYPLLPPRDIHRIDVLGPEEGLSIHVLGADLRRQRRRIFDVDAGTCEEVEGVSMAR
jgi:3-mercaptopropionate dioxygenase